MSTRLDFFQNPQLLINLIKKSISDYRGHFDRIFIIGSLARNDFMIDSDVDLLIVINNQDIISEIKSKLDEILVDKGISYDLIVMTEPEFLKRRNTLLIKECLREGIEI